MDVSKAQQSPEQEVPLFLRGGPHSAQQVRALVERIWHVTHSSVDHAEMLRDLSFLAGVAVAFLVEYSKSLPDQLPE